MLVILRLGVAICLVMYAVLFYLVLKDAEEDRAKGPHHICWEIKHYEEHDRYCWEVWSYDHPHLSSSGESEDVEMAILGVMLDTQTIRDRLVFGQVDVGEGEVWL